MSANKYYISKRKMKEENAYATNQAILNLKKTLQPGSVVSINIRFDESKFEKPKLTKFRVLKLYPHHVWCSDLRGIYHRSINYFDILCGGVNE